MISTIIAVLDIVKYLSVDQVVTKEIEAINIIC